MLKPDGSLAWVGSTKQTLGGRRGPLTPEVGACDSTGEHLLDSSAGIDLQSLALHGSTLTWTDSGETHSAILH